MDKQLVRYYLFTVALSAFVYAAEGAVPSVSSVSAIQRPGTRYVDITYNLSDSDSATLSVSMQISTNGGTTYFSPGNVSGDLGASVARGNNRKIVWDAGATLPAKLFANVKARVTADDNTVTNRLYIAGTFNNWSTTANPMDQIGHNMWRCSIALVNSVQPQFKFLANQSWDVNWGEEYQHDYDLPISGAAGSDNSGNIMINGLVNGTCVFTFSSDTGEYSVSCDTDPSTAILLTGSFNGWDIRSHPMNYRGNHNWRYDVAINSTNNQFKFVENSDWDRNYGDRDQLDYDIPVFGVAEWDYRQYHNIVVTGRLNGVYRFEFNNQTLQYSITEMN